MDDATNYAEHVRTTAPQNSAARNSNSFNQMKCPTLLGSINNVSIGSVLGTVTNNVQTYGLSYPFSGVNPDYAGKGVDQNGFYTGSDYTIGSNYFQEIGACDASTSEPPCQGQPRHVYVRNIPTGKIPILGGVSFQGITGCNLSGLTEGRGFLSGILEDISDIQPVDVALAFGNDGNFGSTACKLETYPVGTNVYDPAMEGTKWSKLTRCTSSYFNQVESTTGRSQLFPTGTPLFEGFSCCGEGKQQNVFLLWVVVAVVVVLFVLFLVLFLI